MILGFRNLDSPVGTIAKCLESLSLDDFAIDKNPNLIALAVTGKGYSDIMIEEIADALPVGQTLWAFSPTSRRITHPRLRLTHVPAGTDREFILKIAGHLDRFIREEPTGSPLNPDQALFPTEHTDVDSLDAFAPEFDVRRTVAVQHRDVRFDFFSDLKSNSDSLVVFGQDALKRERMNIPHFFRWKWTSEIDSSVLILNDPTLYLNETLNAGWWVGTPSNDYVHRAVEVIRHIADCANVGARNVVFVGASAGGFSSLHMAAAYPGSRALVDIPQTNLRTYSEKAEADAAIQAGLGYETAQDVPAELLHRIDVIERFDSEGRIPEFAYFQNMRDVTHVDAQLGDFQSRLAGRQVPSHKFVEYSQWHLTKGGHFPLRKSVMINEINSYLQTAK